MKPVALLKFFWWQIRTRAYEMKCPWCRITMVFRARVGDLIDCGACGRRSCLANGDHGPRKLVPTATSTHQEVAS